MHKLIITYLIIINIVAFILMYSDKEKAKLGLWRIPERKLWTTALLGGAIGGTIAMKVFHHKTKHIQFKLGLPFLSILDIGIAIYAYYL